MKTLIFALLIFVAFPTGATNYYFSATGSDSNDGLTSGSPKQTISAAQTIINGASSGDSILFKRGDTWNGTALRITTDGIILDSYGTGARPKITGLVTLTSFSQSGNVWSKTDSRIQNNKERWVDWYTGSWQDYDRRTGFPAAIRINGTPYFLSKYPNTAPLSFETVDASGYTYVTDATASFTGASSDALAGAQLKIMQGHWSFVFSTITGNNTNTLNITASDFDSQFGDLVAGAKGYVMNSTHSLVMDQNGEFAIASGSKTISIYYDGNLNSQTVQVPILDSIISVEGIGVHIKNLEVSDSRGNGIKVRGVNSNVIYNCKISYCTLQGIQVTGTDDIVCNYNDISHCDNGIGIRHSGYPEIGYNYIHRIGQDPALGDIEGASGNGIYIADRNGNASIFYNYFDSISYNGIHVHSNTGDASPPTTIYGNFGQHWCNMKTDGALYYLVSSNDNVSVVVEKNFAFNSGQNSNLITGNGHTEAFYLDNGQSYTTVDTNYVYNSPSFLFINYSGNYNTVRGNKALTFNSTGYSNAGLYVESLGSVSDLTLTGNEFAVTDAGTVQIKWNGAADPAWSCSGCSFTNNDYFSYYSGSTDFQFIEYWGTVHNYGTLSAWQTFTGLESGSELKYLTTLGATEAIMFANWSNTAHVFNLGSATYKDYDGNNYSSSISIPEYSAKILYHISGSGADNSLYYVIPTAEETGGGPAPSPSGSRIFYDEGIQRIPYDQGIERIPYD